MTNTIGVIAAALAAVVAILLFTSFVLMLAWNASIATIFDISEIDLGQALGLNFVAWTLFGSSKAGASFAANPSQK